jgi:hypothetical protein
MPSTLNVSQRPDPPTKSGGGGISIKQRLGVGALAPTNPKIGPPPPKQALKPLPKSHPPSWAGLKIKKTSLSISTDVNPASGHEESAYGSSMHSPHPTSNVSPNITHLTLNTSVPVSTPSYYQHLIPNETISPSLISQPHMMDEAEIFLQEIMPSG